MTDRLRAAIAANRFGLGARPGDLEHIGSDAPGWLKTQLDEPAPAVGDAALRDSRSVLAEAQEVRREIQEARKAPSNGSAAVQPKDKVGELLRPVYIAEVGARFRQAITTERPFLERLTHFWTNHFAVSVDKALLPGLAGAMEREAIRPNVLGKFRDLLVAAETHPAMLLYLDNQQSTGPHSLAALRRERNDSERKAGINENLAREIMELHTLGVGGGYTQKDVTTFAWVLSGWSIGRPGGRIPEPVGSFVFRPNLHEPGPRTLLGRTYLDQGLRQGVAVLVDLAGRPATARFIATKLVRHFISDDPPSGAVDRVANAFRASDGHLPTVYQALIDAPEAWTSGLAKLKTPADYLISAYRGLTLPAPADKVIVGSFDQLDQRVFAPGSPAGWPDRSADWDGASALLKRIQWADVVGLRLGSRRDARALAPQLLGDNLTAATADAIFRAASPAQAITLLLASPELMRR
jgi:uncharacterized protein (DUF1800 family)